MALILPSIGTVLERSMDTVDTPALLARLSAREKDVLGGIALGLTNSEIAGRLQVTVHAVKFHLASIYRKLGVGNRTEAAVVYLRAQTVLAARELDAAG